MIRVRSPIRADSSEYVDEDAVKAELLWARRFCNSHGWPTIDVTRRSIEETAVTVLQLMEAWHNRRAKAGEDAQATRARVRARYSQVSASPA